MVMKKKKENQKDQLKQWMAEKGLITEKGFLRKKKTADLIKILDEQYEHMADQAAEFQENFQAIQLRGKQLKAVQDALNVLESVRQGEWE
jgi:hypothetical protein